MKKVISTKNAPAAIGPYSQAIQIDNTLYTSGQLGLVPATGEFAGNDIQSQGQQSLKNLMAILDAAGFSVNDVVKTTVFISDISLFAAFNEVYGSFFKSDAPARSCVAVKDLPKGGLVEVELIAQK